VIAHLGGRRLAQVFPEQCKPSCKVAMS
jgi:hypothetical protein